MVSEYDDMMNSMFPRNFESKKVKAERDARMKSRDAYESTSAYDQGLADDMMGDYDDEYDAINSGRTAPAIKHKRANATQQTDDDPDLVGKGFRKIGKKVVNYGKLMSRNVLDVRHMAKGNISGFPTATVSDGFVSNVNKLINGKGVSTEDMEAL
eukprot:scaffold14734_cov348-Ochromonas_danica.AAC.1